MSYNELASTLQRILDHDGDKNRLLEEMRADLQAARAAFDEAMEYADSGRVEIKSGGMVPGGIETRVRFTKPRPVAPWKGEG